MLLVWGCVLVGVLLDGELYYCYFQYFIEIFVDSSPDFIMENCECDLNLWRSNYECFDVIEISYDALYFLKVVTDILKQKYSEII